MRIYVSFYESANYTFESAESNRNNLETLYRIGNEIKEILITDYFNGADKAVEFIGVSRDKEIFEFEIIPNI